MRRVLKYPFPTEPVRDRLELELPAGADVLAFNFQRGVPTVWALVADENPPRQRVFQVVGTGHELEAADVRHVGSALGYGDELVLHCFEVLS